MLKLSPEQAEDAQKMADNPDLPNFSLPGTGKTHTALEAIKLFGAKRNVIVAPPIALHWWEEQAREYLGADARIVKTGSSPLVGDITIMSYGIMRNARERIYETFDGGSLTLDESHNVCNIDAKQTQAVFGNQMDLAGGIAERFDTVWNMTGTPKMNHANDYYTQAAILHPEPFARRDIHNYKDFCTRFTYSQERQYNPRMRPVWKIVGSQNEGLLGRIVYEDIKAIRRKTASSLPKLRERTLEVPVTLPKEIRTTLKNMGHAEILMRINLKGGIIAEAWRLIGLGKVKHVVPYVGDSVKDSPVLLGCWHHEVMDAYVEAFTEMGLRVEKVAGDVSAKMKENIRRAFNDGFIDVLVGQMKSMGVAWNLQEAANHVVIAEVHPSPAIIDQFYKRVYRRGQTQDCIVDKVLGEGMVVDEALDGVRERKEVSDRKIG
ncbi:MAG: SNF2-related protein [Rhodobacter sp.]|nr:SNF2-related protein [Rhodobacter sp.]